MNEDNKKLNEGDFVTCDICGIDAKLSDTNTWFTRCKNETCVNRLLLAQLEPHKRYIQLICQSVIKYNWVAENTSHVCDCKREHTITDIIAEIRCNQPIYKVRPKVPIHEEFKEVKKIRKRENAQEELESFRKRVKELEDDKQDSEVLRKRVKELEEEKAMRDKKYLDTLEKIIDGKMVQEMENKRNMDAILKRVDEHEKKNESGTISTVISSSFQVLSVVILVAILWLK